MVQWHTKYLPVKNPVENPSGWKFPYQGDDWPEKEDWYWVWAGSDNKYHPEPYRSTPAKNAWWSNREQEFLAIVGDVYAWRKAVVMPH